MLDTQPTAAEKLLEAADTLSTAIFCLQISVDSLTSEMHKARIAQIERRIAALEVQAI